MTRKLLLVALPLVLAFPALALAGGAGQTVEIATQIKLANSAPAFHGKVTADNENCVEDRLVKMFMKTSDGRQLLGKTHAKNNGKWKVPYPNLGSGAYYAVAKKVEEGTAGTIYVCLRAKSAIVPVD